MRVLLNSSQTAGPIDIRTKILNGLVIPTALPITLFDSFLELLDTPASYSGQAFNIVRVNAGETALEFGGSAGDLRSYSQPGSNSLQ